MATAQNAKHEINKQVSQPIAAKAYCGSLFKKAKKRERVEDKMYFYHPLKKEIPFCLRNIDLVQFDFDVTADDLTFSTRMDKDNEVFHSDSYPYRRNSCSCFICFKEGQNEENYGVIKCFVMKGQQPYAIIKEYRNLHKNVYQSSELQDPNDPIMLTFQQAGILGTHFTAVAETNNLRKIVCQRILSRVVFVPMKDQDIQVSGYVSKVLKSYQHD